MTALTIHCPLCNGPLQIDASVAGQQVNCPLCQGLLQLPPWEELMGMPPGSLPPPPPSLPPPPPASPWGTPAEPSFALPPPSSEPPPGYWPPPQEIPMGVPVGMAVATQPAPQFPPPQFPPSPDVPIGTAAPQQPPVPEVPAAVGMACPACKSRFEVRPEFAGQTIRCPHCAREMALPKAESLAGMLRPFKRNFPLAIVVEKQPSAATVPPPAGSSPTSESAGRKTEPLPPKLKPTVPPRAPAAASLPPEANLPPAASVAESRPLEKPTETLLPSPVTSENDNRIAGMLPPGASAESPSAPVEPALPAAALPPTAFPTAADVLLPPGTEAGAVVQPGEERALPQLAVPEVQPASLLPSAPAPKAAPGTVVLPTAEGKYKTVRDAPKTVSDRGEEVELRRLTDEEKSRRRLVRNLILVVFCLVIIGITFYVMMPRTGG